MADASENHENPRRFADSDLADLSRPATMVDEAPQGYIKPQLQTITDLASSLDLDFEDDFDSDPLQTRRPDAPAPSIFPQNRKIGLEAWEKESGFSQNNAAAPTWEEFTSAFFRNRSAASAEPEFVEPEPVEVEAVSSIPEQEANKFSDISVVPFQPFDDGEQSEFDVLSSLLSEEETPVGASPADATLDDPWGNDGDLLEAEGALAVDGDEPSSPSPSDTIMDLFSSLDVDAAWRQKLRERDDDSVTSEARSFDLFSDLDLNSLWEKKIQHQSGGDDELNAGETIIIDPSALDKVRGADPMPQAEVFRKQSNPLFQNEPITSKKTKDEQNEQDELLDDDTGLLANLESFLDAGEKALGWKQKNAEVKDARDDSADYLPGDSDAGGAVADLGDDDILSLDFFSDMEHGGSDVLPPTISNGDIQSTRKRRPRSDAAPEAEEPRPPKPHPGKAAAEAPDGEYDTELLDTDAMVSAVQRGAKPSGGKTSGAKPSGGKTGAAKPSGGRANGEESGEESGGEQMRPTLTTDDLLDEVGFDEEDGAADVQAPVVGNDDIDMLKDRPRPGTEEMQAIASATSESTHGEAGGGRKNNGMEPGEPLTGEEDMVEDGEPAEAPVAVNPMDVFANMDDMDFSDDFDDDMKAMLDEDGEGDEDGEIEETDGEGSGQGEPKPEAKGFIGKARRLAGRAFFRVVPERYVTKLLAMLAWKENWWFYCDLLAAIIASASLAVIFSYFLWYRN